MLAEETSRHQKELNDSIRQLSKKLFNDETATDVKKALDVLQSIYLNKNGGFSGFRHNYSDFFPLIVEIHQEGDPNLECLSHNLDSLREYVEQNYAQDEKYRDLYGSLRKLFDHLNLEIARLNYYLNNESAIEKAKQDVEVLKSQTERAEENLRDVSNKTKSLQSEMIAVLSIFSAIVIAFFGDVNFIASAISSLSDVHIYKSAVIVVISGIMLFNSIFVLMYIVARIIDRSIYSPCKTVDCTCTKKCIGMTRIRKRLPYIFWINVLFLVLLLIICGLWFWASQYGNIPL